MTSCNGPKLPLKHTTEVQITPARQIHNLSHQDNMTHHHDMTLAVKSGVKPQYNQPTHMRHALVKGS